MVLKSITQIGLALALSAGGCAIAQDSAVYDPQQNAWRLRYQNPDTGQWVDKLYVARTGIRPRIKSRVTGNGQPFAYQYTVRNQGGARQAISVIRIWGIPTIYSVPNLPPVTTDPRTDMERWTHQQWAQLTARGEFERSVVKAPRGWSGGLRVDPEVGHTSFVWTPGLKDSDPDGIEPGRAQSGFVVLRPELPGVARTFLQGDVEEPWGLDGVPETPFWTAKVAEIQAQDFLLVPVMAPIIAVPVPYSGPELARRIRNHVQTWPKYGHSSADALARLNRQFDVLIPALELNNKSAVRAAVLALRKECSDRHAGLDDDRIEEDFDEHDAGAQARTAAEKRAAPPVILDRVAARALLFNLRYLLQRIESGR